MKPHFFPKTAKKPTCFDKNKWKKKNETVKTVKNFHCKNETRKTVKNNEKVDIFQNHPLGWVTITVSAAGKKISTGKLLWDFIKNVLSNGQKTQKKSEFHRNETRKTQFFHFSKTRT